MSEELERRLVAVMFTDMVGYTALLQADEHLGIGKRQRYIAALERQHDAFGGTIVQRLGDGSLSMFPEGFSSSTPTRLRAARLSSRRGRNFRPTSSPAPQKWAAASRSRKPWSSRGLRQR